MNKRSKRFKDINRDFQGSLYMGKQPQFMSSNRLYRLAV